MTSLDTATQTPPVEQITEGMRCLDTSGNERIPILMEMVGALSRANEPQQVLRTFGRGLRKLQGPRGYISLSTRGLKPGKYRITRLRTEDPANPAAERELDPWSTGEELPVNTGGILGALIRKAYPEIIHHLNVRDDPVLGSAIAEYGSLMAIPLFDNGEPLNWSITLNKEPEGYTHKDLEEGILRANLVGGTVRHTLVAQKLREANKRVAEQVEQIASIQRALLPQTIPQIPGVSLAANYETFDRAGGDIYAIRPLRMIETEDGSGKIPDIHGPWGLLIADASGHGPAAAVVMAMLHAIVEAYPREPDGPGEVLEHVNRHLHAKRIESSFVTAFLGIYDPQTRRFSYARAGHNPPVVMRPGPDAVRERLDAVGGIPLGIMEGVEYENATIDLTPGQTVVFYTDGITEAFNPKGEMFGVNGIVRSLRECSGEPGCAISSITAGLLEHQGDGQPSDDQTIIAMKIEDDHRKKQ